MRPDGWCALPVREAVSLVKQSVDLRELAQTPHVALYSLPAYDAGAKPERASGASVGSNKFRVPQDCVLLAKLNPHIPRVWRVRHEDALPGVCSTEFWPLVPSERGQVDLDYLAHFLRSPQFLAHPLISPSSTTNSHRRIDQTAFQDFSLLLPPLPEQRKISAILSSVDDTIEKTEAVIDQLEVVKKGLLGELLTRGMPGRHKEFKETEIGALPSEWSVVGLFDVATFASGQVDPRELPYRDWPLVAPNHIESETGRILAVESASSQGAISGKYQFAPGDVLYSKIRPYLRKAALAEFQGLCSADMYPLRPSERVASHFLLAILLSDWFTEFATSVSMRTGIPKINREELSQFRFGLPSRDEQDAISQTLKSVSERGQREVERLAATRALKTALLDALLSGRVRVNHATQEAA